VFLTASQCSSNWQKIIADQDNKIPPKMITFETVLIFYSQSHPSASIPEYIIELSFS
jgi:hypothetical protein